MNYQKPDDIYRAVEWALSQWERADEELAHYFQH